LSTVAGAERRLRSQVFAGFSTGFIHVSWKRRFGREVEVFDDILRLPTSVPLAVHSQKRISRAL
jgi:hypothetical protein